MRFSLRNTVLCGALYFCALGVTRTASVRGGAVAAFENLEEGDNDLFHTTDSEEDDFQFTTSVAASIPVFTGIAQRINATTPILGEWCEGGVLAALARVFGLKNDGPVEETFVARKLRRLLGSEPIFRLSNGTSPRPLSSLLYATNDQLVAGLSSKNLDLMGTQLSKSFARYPGMPLTKTELAHIYNRDSSATLLTTSEIEVYQAMHLDKQSQIYRNMVVIASLLRALAGAAAIPDRQQFAEGLMNRLTTKEQSLLQKLSPLILHLMSPLFGRMVGDLFGEGLGPAAIKLDEDPIDIHTAKKGMINDGTPLMTLLGVACDFATAQDDGSMSYLRNMRASIGMIGAALGCSDESLFDAGKTCTKLPDKMYDVDTCNRNDGKVVDMRNSVVDIRTLRDYRATNNGLVPMVLQWDDLDYDERFLHFLTFRANTVLMAYATSQYPCGNKTISVYQELYPGWNETAVFSYYQPGSTETASRPRKDDVLVVASQPKSRTAENECDIIASIRGTSTAYEWAMNIDITMTPVLDNPTYQVHRGFYRVVAAVWPEWNAWLLDQAEICESKGKPLSILVTGHSFGAAVASVLGLATKVGNPSYNVSVIAGGPPASLNTGALDFYRRNVNVRTLIVSHDPVASSPITTEAAAYGTPRYAFGDTHDGKPLLYRDYPGRVLLDLLKVGGPDMLDVGNSFGRIALGNFPLDEPHEPVDDFMIRGQLKFPGIVQVGPSHVCSYACIFSLDACSAGDPQKAWMCRNCAGQIPDIEFEVPLGF